MQHPILKKSLTVLACAAALSGCDPLETDSLTGSSDDLGLPEPAILQTRAVDRALLRPLVTVGVGASSSVVMRRDGETWVGRFSLPPDTGTTPAEYPLNVQWMYDIRMTGGATGDDIVLARAPEQIITNNSPRQITVGAYSVDFDEDGDGTNNLAELNADRNPLVRDNEAIAVAPNANQSDCRDTQAGLVTRLAPIIRLSGPFNDTQSIERAANNPVFGQAFFVETQGTLTIERLSGLPDAATLVLFDRPAGSDETRPIAADALPPLTMQAALEPGLYCFGAVVADLANQVFSDVTMRYSFQP